MSRPRSSSRATAGEMDLPQPAPSTPGRRRAAALTRYGGAEPEAAAAAAAAGSGSGSGTVRRRAGPAVRASPAMEAPRGPPQPLRQNTVSSAGRSSKGKSALNLLEEAKPRKGKSWCNPHRSYQWICAPYMDKWLPYPSKKTLHKTLNRLDFNAFNPYSLYEDYFVSFTTPFGMLFTLGCVTLLVLYSLFAAQVFLKDNRVQQDSFVALEDDLFFATSPATGVAVLDAAGDPLPSLDALGLSYEAVECDAEDVCAGAALEPALRGVLGLPALGPPDGSDGFRMRGHRTQARHVYTRVRLVHDGASSLDALEGGTFVVVSDGALAGLPEGGSELDEVGDPSHGFRQEFPFRGAALSAEASVRYRRHEAEFPSKVLRDAVFERYTQFYVAEAVTRTAAGGVLFEARFEMDATRHERKYVGETALDVVSNIGGILMLIKLVVLVFSVYVVQEAFKQTRKLKVNPAVARALLHKKKRQLDRFKRDLTEAHTENAMRLTRDELYDYVNSKRDSELATFRHALFSSLNTRSKNNAGNVRDVWDIASAPVKETVDEAHKAKRNDELQELVRVDEADREEDPELPKVLNILAMDEIQRQTAVLQEFLRGVSRSRRLQ